MDILVLVYWYASRRYKCQQISSLMCIQYVVLFYIKLLYDIDIQHYYL